MILEPSQVKGIVLGHRAGESGSNIANRLTHFSLVARNLNIEYCSTIFLSLGLKAKITCMTDKTNVNLELWFCQIERTRDILAKLFFLDDLSFYTELKERPSIGLSPRTRY